jgi:hypothetical protein
MERRLFLWVATIFIGCFMWACSNTDEAEVEILKDRIGTLSWGGSPAADGSGLLFQTENVTYGIPGDKSDYEELFPLDSEQSATRNQVSIRTDLSVSGDIVARGWGVTFKEATLINPKRIKTQIE